MPTTNETAVKDLSLDLANFRTVKQKNEINAVNAMISIGADSFWALLESLLDDGFMPTENIIVIKGKNKRFIVKEGNRRVACMKVIYGFLDRKNFGIPTDLAEKIDSLSTEWQKENKSIPCAIYEATEEMLVDKIVSLTHGKAQKAGRVPWESVARARHNRDILKVPEEGLELLEKYLVHGSNLTGQQKDRWAGVYPLTVLNETLPKLFPRFQLNSTKEFVKAYPKMTHKNQIEELLRLVGNGDIGFPEIRSDGFEEVLVKMGFPKMPKQSNPSPKPEKGKKPPPTKKKGKAAHPVDDPKTVKFFLRKFNPTGANNQKIATLKEEALSLNLSTNPIAFCFLLRSMFELSAKNYCDKHNISLKKVNTKTNLKFDKTMLELLKEATNHLTNNKKDKGKVQQLHGAMVELGKTEGILSVTSMNQLVHNRTFVVTASEISTLFNRIYPLLEYLN
jgi:hypothetical protein